MLNSKRWYLSRLLAREGGTLRKSFPKMKGVTTASSRRLLKKAAHEGVKSVHRESIQEVFNITRKQIVKLIDD